MALAVAIAVGLGIGSVVQLPVADADVQTHSSISGDIGVSGDNDGSARSFDLCHFGGGTDCVVDGDTFWMDGEKIRVADIDAPETHPSRCAEEERLGNAATARLQALLNAGPVELASADRDTDRYGRKLRIVTQNGRSIGSTLIDEGLARPWEGERRPWCGPSA